jgi:nicotinamide mononucleotide (NMN) deamidase PncC
MNTELVRQIHGSGRRLAIAVTGAGSGVIAALLRVPGASRTLVEAVVPYGAEALAEFLGRMPDHACSPETATALAVRARERVVALSGATAAPRVGLGVTATVATDRPKRGDHRGHLAVATDAGIEVVSIVLEKGARDRAAEEDLFADAALLVLAHGCGVDAPDVASVLGAGDRLTREARPLDDPVADLVAGSVARATVRPDGRVALDAPRPAGLLPGSFNPLHEGHRALARIASGILGGPVAFELSVVNADKPPLGADEVRRRLAQFRGEATVELTRAPTFREKARLFPGASFVVGVDTAERVLHPRYYEGGEAGMHAALDEIGRAGCRFLVAGRVDPEGRFATVSGLDVPAPFTRLFVEIPEARFRHDVSSSALRARC